MTADGRRTTMPARMISEIPLPIPFSEICSPIHMMSAVPAVSVTTVSSRKAQPGVGTIEIPDGLRMLSSPYAMPMAWGADPVGDQHRRREQDAALQLGDLEDVLKALEAFDHEAVTCAPSTSTRPPFASIFARADALTACAFTVRACATSPVPRIFTRARSRPLMSPAWARASGSTTAFVAKPPRAPRFTMAYGFLPPYGRNPRLGSRR